MSVSGTKTHIALDVREGGVHVEFVEVSKGNSRALAQANLDVGLVGGTVAGAPVVVQGVRELLANNPQMHPSAGVVFLHAPLFERSEVRTVKQMPTSGPVSPALITLVLDELPKADPARALVHEYVAAYTINGYRIHDPRGKVAREFGITLARVFVPDAVRDTLLAPLQAVLGVPLRCASYADTLVRLIEKDETVTDALLVDIASTSCEVVRIYNGEYFSSIPCPVGAAQILAALRTTSEMSEADVANALPLLAQNSLEEVLANRLRQGVRAAAELLHSAVIATQPSPVQPMPILISGPLDMRPSLQLLACEMPFTTLEPVLDLPRMVASL